MKPTRHRSILLILALAGVVVATTACSSSGSLGQVPTTPPTPAPSIDQGPPDETPAPSVSPSPTGPAGPTSGPSSSPSPSTPVETMVVRAYYVLSGKVEVAGLVPTLRVVPKTSGVARAAMAALLDSDKVRETYPQIATAIPAGTKLLGVSIKNGVATVDLSREFEAGGGSASAFYRLGQVVYTLTQFSTVRSVLFQVEGQTVTTFGPEGIVLEGPQARRDFRDQLPTIFVDRPAFGAAAGNPVRVTGSADVFEATFRIAVLDGSGKVLTDQHAMANCGAGCEPRGTFDVTLKYDVAKAQWGTLRVYYGSAKDGSPQGIRDYPVWLTRAP
jgi:sporulation and spore germination protein/immunoglobulin-like protein involved in spore germination